MTDNLHNPDVLSCLANLSNDEVFTPPKVVNAMLDLLPQELFRDPNARFLDVGAKSGVFLREIAKRLIAGLAEAIPDLRRRVDHVLQRQVYGIATTELTALVSRRTLYCSKSPNGPYSASRFATAEGNVRFRDVQHDFVNGRCRRCGASEAQFGAAKRDGLETHAYEFIHAANPKEIFNMKFDVVVGNPPYQMSTGGSKSQATPLYDKFVLQSRKLNPRYLLMIIPDRWFSGGFGLNDFRREMLGDRRIKNLYIFPLSSDCFPGVDIPGGICYFLWAREHSGDCMVTVNDEGKESTMMRPLLEEGANSFIKYNDGVSIFRKVNSAQDFVSIETIVSPQKPFGLGTTFVGEENESAECPIKVYGRNMNVSYVEANMISNSKLSKEWKVFISASYGERTNKNLYVLGRPFIGEPNSVCTETYIAFMNLKNETECANLMGYVATRFFRFMILLKKATQHALRNVYSFVPLQDFSKPWTDEELYAKYGLDAKEIAFIESMIRPME